MKLLKLVILITFCSCSSTKVKSNYSQDDVTNRNANLVKEFHKESPKIEKFKVVSVKQDIPKSKIVKTKKVPSSKKNVKLKRVVKANTVPKAKLPRDFTPFFNKGERAKYDIEYMGLNTGAIVIESKSIVSINNKKAYHLHARAKTANYYSYLYELDDNIDSFVEFESFLPIKYSLIQRESGQNIDDLQLFDRDKNEVTAYYKRTRKKDGNEKKFIKSEELIQFYQDPLSMLYYMRGLPMDKEGYEVVVPVYNKSKIVKIHMMVGGTESIQTELGEKICYKVDIISNYKGDTVEKGKMNFWFDTSNRVLMRFKAKIKIGSISGEIVEYDKN